MLASGTYKRNLGVIELELSREIRAFFFDIKNNFTHFRLKVALSLKSKYAKRIYEMLSQFKDTGVLRMSIVELKERLNIIDFKTRKEKYTKYGLFRAKVLEVAQKELSQKADITFTYEAIKTGRQYTHLRLEIKDNKPIVLQTHNTQVAIPKESAVEGSVERILQKLVEKYQLSAWQAHRILKNVPLKEIHKTTYAIQLEIVNKKLHNIGGYTAKVFDQKYGLGLFKIE